MIRLNKILIATDFSENSERAYPVAQKIASRHGCKADILHVIPTLTYLNESLKKIGVPIDMAKDVFPKILEERKKSGEEILERYFGEENRGECTVLIDRKPSEIITGHAERNGHDLIIMGARGKHGTRFLRGGTTERVIRNSTVPVLSIHETFEVSEIRSILVPTDSSRLSFSALPWAAAMASLFDAELTLFHVMELYGSPSEDIPRVPEKGEAASVYETLIERLSRYLSEEGDGDLVIESTDVPFEDQLAVRADGEKRLVRLRTKIEKGVSAHLEIEKYAEEHSDLVVMATHGHGGLSHLFLGSTSEKVAQNLSCPVLTIRPEKKKQPSSKS